MNANNANAFKSNNALALANLRAAIYGAVQAEGHFGTYSYQHQEALAEQSAAERAYAPTELQWSRAFAIAKAHGHWWACLLSGATLTPWAHGRVATVGDVIDLAQGLIAEGDQGGEVPRIDDAGNIYHRTGTGRAQWTVAPDGRVSAKIQRPQGTALRVYLWREVAAEVVPELARIRHWRAAATIIDALGEDFARKFRGRMSPVVERALNRIDIGYKGLRECDAALAEMADRTGCGPGYGEAQEAYREACALYQEGIERAEKTADLELDRLHPQAKLKPARAVGNPYTQVWGNDVTTDVAPTSEAGGARRWTF